MDIKKPFRAYHTTYPIKLPRFYDAVIEEYKYKLYDYSSYRFYIKQEGFDEDRTRTLAEAKRIIRDRYNFACALKKVYPGRKQIKYKALYDWEENDTGSNSKVKEH